MEQRLRGLRSEVGFWIVVILVGLAAWKGVTHLNNETLNALAAQGGIAGVVSDTAQSSQATVVNAFLGDAQQITTMGTAVLGGVFYLLFSGRKGEAWTKGKAAMVLGSIFVCLSIYAGFVAYSYIIAAVADSIPDPIHGSNAYAAQQAQFYLFLLGVVCFANFIFHNLPTEAKREN